MTHRAHRHRLTRYVQISVFGEQTGYSADAIDKKIKRGVWREGVHYRRAPDGHILLDWEAYEAWVENRPPEA
jgi:hypothetical protein